jgi:hypothetical protein
LEAAFFQIDFFEHALRVAMQGFENLRVVPLGLAVPAAKLGVEIKSVLLGEPPVRVMPLVAAARQGSVDRPTKVRAGLTPTSDP